VDDRVEVCGDVLYGNEDHELVVVCVCVCVCVSLQVSDRASHWPGAAAQPQRTNRLTALPRAGEGREGPNLCVSRSLFDRMFEFHHGRGLQYGGWGRTGLTAGVSPPAVKGAGQGFAGKDSRTRFHGCVD
jgi:hypothetical protein